MASALCARRDRGAHGRAAFGGAVDAWAGDAGVVDRQACTRPEPTAQGARRERWTYSEQDLAQQMLAFVETYNQTAKPFKWTYTGKVLEA